MLDGSLLRRVGQLTGHGVQINAVTSTPASPQIPDFD
jgi:hypothetical protein